jgi:hypothetical protein
MPDDGGWKYMAGLGVLIALAGLELRSGKGILWKRVPGGTIHSGLGVAFIVLGILVLTFSIVNHLSPR